MDREIREQYFTLLKQELRELLDPETGKLSERFAQIVPCPLCGEGEARQRELFVKEGYRFVRCESCLMIFSNPQVKANEIQENYEASPSSDLWVSLQKSEKERGWKTQYYGEALSIIRKHIQKSAPTLLDVGCSVGHFLEIVRENCPDWKMEGVEFNRLALEHCRSKNFFVYDLPLKEMPRAMKYDVVSLFGVLEHIARPHQFLQDINEKTEKESLLMIVVPNVYSLYHMFLQEQSRSFDGRNHLLYFSKDSLQKLLAHHGWEIVHLDTVLTGLDNIFRQMQWLDPNSTENTRRYLPMSLAENLDEKKMEQFILDNDLGLRLRVLARKN